MASSSRKKNSTDVSDPSLGGSKRLRSRIVPPRPKAKPKAKSRKERKYSARDRQRHDVVRPYATDALLVYNESTGTEYELVEPGYISHAVLSTCFLHHIDFTAKKTDVADAPEEMFFSELTSANRVRSVEFVNCMGPKKLISGDKNNGCCYCMRYNVQHPRTGGFLAGGKGLFRDE
ncbi:hypothetical protein MKW94_002879 [Papaver nudicaule]|uniref:DUF3615 domain-containing protein n=1 Tax=Papaver nudicaule TaxID=74823 RepID=A0AA41S217_PAPNU|nr:hypothetical protein [Papaver nudicaule]